jgi:hypothetical protein
MPIDPESGGTWIAANDAGIVFALLNANPGAYPPITSSVRSATLSRGTIIPSLIASATVAEALARAERIQVERYAPFRLLLFDRFQLVECAGHGGRIRRRRSYLSAAIMRTSSGLGDAVVAGPRRALFQRFFSYPDDASVAQDRFHQHRWIGREAVSVNMDRSDARTVSRTIVEVGSDTISMSYVPADSAEPVVVRVAA